MRGYCRTFSIFMVIILVMGLISPMVFAEGGVGIEIIEYSTGGGTIHPDDDFNLNMTVKNSNSEKVIEKLYIEFDRSSSFYPENKGSKVLVGENIGKGAEEEFNIKLIYDGTGTGKMPITFTYKVKDETGYKSTDHYIGVMVDQEEEDDEEEIDKDKYQPTLRLDDNRTYEIDAGDSEDIDLEIRNTSSYDAEDVVISATLGEGSSPIYIDGDQYFDFNSIDERESEDIDLDISVDKTAKAGSYPIKLSYEFENRYGTVFTGTDTIYIKVTNNSEPPRIVMNPSFLETGPVNAGEETLVFLDVENKGSLEAKDINVSLEGLDSDKFTISYGSNSRYITSIDSGDKESVDFLIKASENMTSGSYPLTFKAKYKDDLGKEHTQQQQFFVSVESDGMKKSNIQIENIQGPKKDYSVNENFSIKFNLVNQGQDTGENIKISVKGGEEIIPKSQSIKIIRSIAPGETIPMEFIMSATDEAKSRNYPISVNVEYDEKNGNEVEKHTFNQYVGVNVYNNEEDNDNKSVPKIIVSEYKSDPVIVNAGEEFDLYLQFKNTHSSKLIRNIKVFLTIEQETDENVGTGNVFTPVKSSNTFYIDSIGPKQTAARSLKMYTMPDAKPKYYEVTANFEYEDGKGEQHTAKELIGIHVKQPTELEIGDVEIPPEAYVGQPSPVSLQIYNTGRVDLRNLKVELQGDFDTQNGSFFFGNFDSGYSDYFEGMVIPNQAGKTEGKIVATYEDVSGEEIKVTKDFSINAVEMPAMDENGPPMEQSPMEGEEEDGSIWKNKYLWAGLGTIILLGAIFIIRKKIKEKKGMDFDE